MSIAMTSRDASKPKNMRIIYIYIYAFSRHFYPKRLTLHSSFYILSALAFPGNRTHDLGVASAMLYQLSYRKAVNLRQLRKLRSLLDFFQRIQRSQNRKILEGLNVQCTNNINTVYFFIFLFIWLKACIPDTNRCLYKMFFTLIFKHWLLPFSVTV